MVATRLYIEAMDSAMADRIVCDILTGFLGSGKSTLLNAFLRRQPKNGIAVIVNEFGSIRIDQLTLKEVAADIYLLDSGCLCCSVINSLKETLLEIHVQAQSKHLPLQRIIIETSGLADPVPLLHVLLGDRTITDYFVMGEVITVVDAVHGAAQLRDRPEALRQAAVAERLVITKVDEASAGSRAGLRRMLNDINPGALIVESAHGDAAAAIFSAPAAASNIGVVGGRSQYAPCAQASKPAYLGNLGSGLPRHNPAIRSWGAYFEERPSWAGVSAWWNLLVHKYGNGLLRCKGLLQIADLHQPVLIQGVGKVFHAPQPLKKWPDSDPRCRVVCIGVDLDDDWLYQSLRAMTITESSGRPLTLEELDECP